MLVEEEYKIIKNFENYAVSNTGKVKRITKGHNTYIGKELYQSINNAGYKTVILGKDKKAYCKTIHKLVAEAFLEKPDDYGLKKYDIDHIDNDKLNNNVDNLQFLTHRDNMKKRWRVDHIYTYKVIYNDNIYEFKTQQEIADALHVSIMTVNYIYHKKIKRDGLEIYKI